MLYLEIKDWERHQTPVKVEKRRDYIALYTDLLYDPDFLLLPASAQVLLIKCWLYRGRTGKNVPNDIELLAQVFAGAVCEDDLQFLIEDGWIRPCESKHPPQLRKLAKKKGVAGYTDDFEEWWKIYPRPKTKADAFRAWLQTADVRPALPVLLRMTKAYAIANKSTEERYIKLPGGWLRDRRWEDDVKMPKKKTKQSVAEKLMAQEQVEHFAHPRWKFYVSAVISGECQTGFEEFISGH